MEKKGMKATSWLAMVAWGLAVSPVFGYGIEENAGLRWAQQLSPTTIRLVVGPGFTGYQLDQKISAFQVASETDTRFQHGVAASSVRVVGTEPDGTIPEGWKGRRYEQTTLEMQLPADQPLKAGQRYWVRINSAWIMAKNKQTVWVEAPNARPTPQALASHYGIRELYVLSPRALHVITGAGLDLNRLTEKGNVTVSSPDDPAFATPVAPDKIGRRSNLDFYEPSGWPWKVHQRHELFLLLPKPLSAGKTYVVELNTIPGQPVTCGQSSLRIVNDDRQALNLAIKVNQVGYLPDAEKYGYLGLWMGDAGAYDFAESASSFEVRDATTHHVVLRGVPTLRHRAGTKTETVYKQDLSYENTWQLDLTPLQKPGRYYVAVPGMGRSFSFRVGGDVYIEPTRVAMNGVLHQRCGIELKAPYATPGVYRPACHRKNTEYGTMASDKLQSGDLVDSATDGKKYDLYGGHHDAGDWDPRSRLDYAENLLLLYELNSRAFTDRQFNIPEAGNGIPDLLDEARWSLDLWTRLQDDDGGVHSKVETNGDPLDGDVPDTDHLREFAFRKEPGASFRYAANAAWASMIWRDLGRKAEADALLARAVKAWNWGEAHLSEFSSFKGGSNGRCVDQLTFAAARLLQATGDSRYDAAFHQYSIMATDPMKAVAENDQYDQSLGSYTYARLPVGVGDAKLKSMIVASFEREFDAWRKAAETTNYRYLRSPYAPNTWGTGGLPAWLTRPAMTGALTRDVARQKSVRQWILFTNDFSLGCHPMNLVFSTGQGQRSVTGNWSGLQAMSPVAIIPGLHSNGPGGRGTPGEKASGGMGGWPNMSLYPTGEGSWPDLYRYSENASPGQNEGCWPQRMAFAYGLFLPSVK